jgi:hypothetical protein
VFVRDCTLQFSWAPHTALPRALTAAPLFTGLGLLRREARARAGEHHLGFD